MHDPNLIEQNEYDSQEENPIHKLERTRQLILDKDLAILKEEIKRSLNYERDVLIQSMTEREIRYDQELLNSEIKLKDLTLKIDSIKKEVDQLEVVIKEIEESKKKNFSLRQRGITYSEIAFRLLHPAKPKTDL